MKITARWLRSVQGQLSLLAIALGGAVVLAVAALCFRSIFFERYVSEKYRQPTQELATLLLAVADGSATDGQREKLADESGDKLFEAWMVDDKLDAEGRLARYLWSTRGGAILDRVRRTLAAGDAEQRLRVLDLLAWAEQSDQRAAAAELCQFAVRKAERRGESQVAARAGAVLARMGERGALAP